MVSQSSFKKQRLVTDSFTGSQTSNTPVIVNVKEEDDELLLIQDNRVLFSIPIEDDPEWVNFNNNQYDDDDLMDIHYILVIMMNLKFHVLPMLKIVTLEKTILLR